jgi:uncharacterized damage-inducible protein DinB
MASTDTVHDAHAWLRWLTGRTLTACESLSPDEFRREFPIGIGSVHATLVHLVGAERIWIAVLENSDPAVTMPSLDELPDAAGIAAAWKDVRVRWDAYLARLDERELAAVRVRVRDGKEYRQSVADILMQVPTHALYHNAQLSFMFRSMGKSLPDSSWILWGRERLAGGGR